ncbi:MAG: hypothetical protein AB7E55_32830 [Pigmentiphaga sp.]
MSMTPVQGSSPAHWGEVIRANSGLGIRYRPPYNARHTYATMCLMAGMRPAFIAKQLGHSLQILLSRYARWLDGEGDWDEMQKLQIGPKLVRSES